MEMTRTLRCKDFEISSRIKYAYIGRQMSRINKIDANISGDK